MSFAWHSTAAGLIAWLQPGEDPDLRELIVAEVNNAGVMAPGSVVGLVPNTDWLLAWGEWGFVMNHYDWEEPSSAVYLLTPEVEEGWRLDGGNAWVASDGQVLIIRYNEASWHGEFLLTSVTDGAIEPPTVLDWVPDEAFVAWSPDGDRLAFLAQGSIDGRDRHGWQIEVWRPDGVLLNTVTLSQRDRLFDLAWSPDGRFLLASGVDEEHVLVFYDTFEDVLHQIEFETWVTHAFVSQPR